MAKKFAIYCSGGASRVLKFYRKYSWENFKVEFVYYDGNSEKISNELLNINNGIKLVHFQNDNNLSGSKFSQKISDELLLLLNEHKVDVLFCFGMAILKKNLIDLYKNQIVNFHPSLLPAFPGKNAIDEALKYGVKYLGNTAHFIDEGIDTGKIIMQTVLAIEEFNDYEDLLSLQLDMLKELFLKFSK